MARVLICYMCTWVVLHVLCLLSQHILRDAGIRVQASSWCHTLNLGHMFLFQCLDEVIMFSMWPDSAHHFWLSEAGLSDSCFLSSALRLRFSAVPGLDEGHVEKSLAQTHRFLQPKRTKYALIFLYTVGFCKVYYWNLPCFLMHWSCQ